MKRHTLFSAAAFALSLITPCVAQVTETKDAMPAGLRSLVEAELAFSRLSKEKGMKEAFIANAADDGVIFRRTAVNAKEAWRNTDPAPTGVLTWYPVFADISRAGDLGYTTGPFELRAKASDGNPAGTGHFFTVWRSQPDGSWKFVLDMGISHKPSAGQGNVLRYPPGHGGGKAARGGGAAAALRSLLEAEGGLARASASGNAASALVEHASQELRLYRQGRAPFVGLAASRGALEGATGAAVWEVKGSGAAASGDLGYVYGTYERRGSSAEGRPVEAGNYVRVWKREPGSSWRVVLDITNPVPQSPPGQ